MNVGGRSQCLSFLCNIDGEIIRVLRDDLNLAATIQPGKAMRDLADEGSRYKVDLFFSEIYNQNAAFEWELELKLDDGNVHSLRFNGGLNGKEILIVGGVSGVSISFYEEMMRINNEQINQLRAALKDQSIRNRETVNRDMALYNEFTQLNNDLMTTQRELTRKNQELNAQRERYRMISELISDYAYSLRIEADGSLHYEWITEAFTRITGYHADNLAGPMGLLDYVHPDDVAYVKSGLDMLRQGRQQILEFRLTTHWGELRWLRDYMKPIRTDGDVVRVFGAAQDISEVKAAQQNAIALSLEREKMRILSEFIRDASHEFRTPLTLINTGLYLAMRARSEEQRQQQLHRVEEQAASILRLVDALVTMSGLDSAPTRTLQPNDLNIIVNYKVVQKQAVADDSQVRLTMELCPTPVMALTDVNQIGLAVEQIIDNALRFTPNGGHVTVSTRQAGATAVIEVADTGMGITPEDLPHIFNRFFRHDSAHQTRGFGLGLSIAKKIVDNHGGHIDVNSTPGSGSVFRIVLPSGVE